MSKFEEIKQVILARAKSARACTEQYGRAYKSESIEELMTVIKDNFHWCCDNEVLTVDLIEKYAVEFNTHYIYANVDVKSGYLLCDNATVRACDTATVRAYDTTTVRAWGNATVRACDNATGRA